MRFHFTRQELLAVTTKFPVPAFAVKFIVSHSQSFPTLPVATFQEAFTIILELPVISASVIVKRLLFTGIDEPKSTSVSVKDIHPPHQDCITCLFIQFAIFGS